MKLKESLAAEYWIDNTKKIYEENLHVSSPVMEAYEAGLQKGLELAAEHVNLSWTNEIYRGLFPCEAIEIILPKDILELGNEEQD